MDDLTELYCLIDDFCKEFELHLNAHLLADGKPHRSRKSGLSKAELTTLVALFHKIHHLQVQFSTLPT